MQPRDPKTNKFVKKSPPAATGVHTADAPANPAARITAPPASTSPAPAPPAPSPQTAVTAAAPPSEKGVVGTDTIAVRNLVGTLRNIWGVPPGKLVIVGSVTL